MARQSAPATCASISGATRGRVVISRRYVRPATGSIRFATSIATPFFQHRAQHAEVVDEILDPVVGIEAARVRKHPGQRLTGWGVLASDGRLRPTEPDAIGADAEDGHGPWPVADDLGHELASAALELIRGELVGAGRGPRAQVRDPDTETDQRGVFARGEEPRREAGGVHRLPEAIPRAAEVVADRGRVEPGVDAAEEDAQPRRDHVAESSTSRTPEGGDVRTQGRHG